MKHLYQVSVPIADLRAAPDLASELLTQAVLATPAEAQESRGPWTLVDLPDYRGWLRSTELMPDGRSAGRRFLLITAPRVEAAVAASPSPLALYAGTVLTERERSAEVVLAELPDGLAIQLPAAATAAANGRAAEPPAARIEYLLAFVRLYLGSPYLWGGWTVEGIDCSGLVQLAYRIVGHALPRDAHQQHAGLVSGVPPEALRPGDLVFFREDGRISHVGIFVGEGCYLHASKPAERVVISHLFDPVDEIGRAYAARYAGARRVIRDE